MIQNGPNDPLEKLGEEIDDLTLPEEYEDDDKEKQEDDEEEDKEE